MSDIINSVLQEWVMTLNWKEQTGLISAIRGTDGINLDEEVDDKCKCITKMIRFLVLNNADSKTNFMELDVVYHENDVSDVLHIISNFGSMYKHWYDHIIMAINIIYKKHNNPYVRHYYKGVKDYLELKISGMELEAKLKYELSREKRGNKSFYVYLILCFLFVGLLFLLGVYYDW